MMYPFVRLGLFAVLAFAAVAAWGGIESQAGPYRIEMSTQPQIVPVGRAKVTLEVRDASGKAIEGLAIRAIARMPGMFMGEREQTANPVPGSPGSYAFEGSFPMAGAYEVEADISGTQGQATAKISVRTGQDTGDSAGGFSLLSLVPWVFGIALIVFVIVRMRATGQRAEWRTLFNRGTIGGILLLGALFALAMYAVQNWRRPGAMTPIEAQVMEMNTPAPPGSTAVELATVKTGSVVETVRYSGQAVAYVEQDVVPRGTGVLVSMPFYVGDKVSKGQVLARLDTSQLDPQLAERAAMTNAAAQGVGVAAAEYQAALQEVSEARADVSVKESGVAEAESMLVAAQQDRATTAADAAVTETELADAKARVQAAAQDYRFRNDELERMKKLFDQKAISRSELQQVESEAAAARAELQYAETMVRATESKIAAAKANLRKADAMATAAEKRVRQARAELRAARSAVVSKQRAADAAKLNIGRERAMVDQARAGYDSAAAQRGYAALKSEIDGVVTQRLIGPGTLVNPGQIVLKVSQVSPIRLQANIAMADVEKIKVGSTAVIVSQDPKVAPIRTRVTSVSPALDPQSRTGVVEVVWPNADRKFLPGQFVTMEIGTGEPENGLLVPAAAVQQSPGHAKPFVWVASPAAEAGRFTVRRVGVETGTRDGKNIAIRTGLTEGQQVVVQGASSLREGQEVAAPVAETSAKGPVVEVRAAGYTPSTLTVKAGRETTITFVRIEEEGCGQEVVFPDLGIKKFLPLNKPVAISITPKKTGTLRFTCGMDMMEGKVIVQ